MLSIAKIKPADAPADVPTEPDEPKPDEEPPPAEEDTTAEDKIKKAKSPLVQALEDAFSGDGQETDPVELVRDLTGQEDAKEGVPSLDGGLTPEPEVQESAVPVVAAPAIGFAVLLVAVLALLLYNGRPAEALRRELDEHAQ